MIFQVSIEKLWLFLIKKCIAHFAKNRRGKDQCTPTLWIYGCYPSIKTSFYFEVKIWELPGTELSRQEKNYKKDHKTMDEKYLNMEKVFKFMWNIDKSFLGPSLNFTNMYAKTLTIFIQYERKIEMTYRWKLSRLQ